MLIDIARDFTTVPGPRYRRQGAYSGEEFREDILKPRFVQAQQAKEQLIIQLDGTKYGYPTSFLEETFGGLAREFGIETVQSGLVFRTTQEPMLEEEIRHYVTHANATDTHVFDPKGN